MSAPPGGLPPQGVVMQMVMGAWVSQAIASVAHLDVPDLLQRHGPLSARELTEQHGVDAAPAFLERALRACASVGVFSESADGRFGPTALSEVLTRDAPGSVRSFVELIGGPWWKTWTHLRDALRTGAPQSDAARAFGMESPEELEEFGKAMQSRREPVRGVVELCDFAPFESVVDVGGGFGHLALALLKRHPHLRAVVVDLPEVAERGAQHAANEEAGVRDRLTFAGQDMFEDVPPGDAYVLCGVIHDWDDAHCLRVLRHCRARMPEKGRVFCVDAVLPPLGDTSAIGPKFLDLHMLLSLSGKERTEPEWRALLDAADLEVLSIRKIGASDTHIVESGPR